MPRLSTAEALHCPPGPHRGGRPGGLWCLAEQRQKGGRQRAFDGPRGQVLILGFLRALLLSFCFGLAVKLGLGASWSPLSTAARPVALRRRTRGAPGRERAGAAEGRRGEPRGPQLEAQPGAGHLLRGHHGGVDLHRHPGARHGARDGAGSHLLHPRGGMHELGASGHEILRISMKTLEIPTILWTFRSFS